MDCCCCSFSCQWQRGQMNSNEGGYTAMWQQQRRDTMTKSFCPMKTEYKLLSCIEYLRTKETLDVGFQVFKSWSSRLLLAPFPLKIFSLVNGKRGQTNNNSVACSEEDSQWQNPFAL